MAEADPTMPLTAADQRLLKDEPPEIRNGFIRKVYGILSAQLLLTAAVAAPLVEVQEVRDWIKEEGQSLIIAVSVLNIGLICAMACCRSATRSFPTNYIMLFAFTATEGFLVGVICSAYTGSSVMFAVLATGFLVGGLTIYACTTKSDFTGMGGYLFAALLVLMIFGLFCAFFPSDLMQNVYCCLGILIFSFYLIFDTQLIMGKGELRLGIDDYVFAALNLYLDIIQLFLYILQLFGERR
jgi:FtsH-binding integral membrane protein